MYKVLFSEQFNSNNEQIELDVIQTDKGISININGKTMDVFINGEEYYSKFDSLMYAHIPTQLRDWVEKNMQTGDQEFEKKDGFVKLYLYFNNREYFIKIPTNRAKNNNIYIVGDLYSYSELFEGSKITDANLNRENDKFDNFINKISDFGYKLQFSHNAQDYYNYWQLVVPMDKFNEELIDQCIKIWQNYDDEL
jgi:hypothetical protein